METTAKMSTRSMDYVSKKTNVANSIAKLFKAFITFKIFKRFKALKLGNKSYFVAVLKGGDKV